MSLPVLTDPMEATKTYSRIVQRLAGLIQDRTEHGYVFRTDLRLRPDPGATPVALPIDAALTYYEARGQNWERAAWIKARPCAGDLAVLHGEGLAHTPVTVQGIEGLGGVDGLLHRPVVNHPQGQGLAWSVTLPGMVD